MEREALEYAISRIIEYQQETPNTEDDFNAGKSLAYVEVLGVIKDALEFYNLPIEEYGLDKDFE